MHPADFDRQWPKRCGECKTEWSETYWKRLPLTSRAALSLGADVELRRCPCGAAIGAVVASE
jgi:hypothetical protein